MDLERDAYGVPVDAAERMQQVMLGLFDLMRGWLNFRKSSLANCTLFGFASWMSLSAAILAMA